MKKNVSGVAVAALSLCVVSACANKPPPFDKPSATTAVEAPIWSKKEKKAWKRLAKNSSIKQVADDQMVIDAWGGPLTDPEAIERRLLARAGAEAHRLGFSHFAIVQIADRNKPIYGGFGPGLSFHDEDLWIGSYSELAATRFERDYASAARSWVNPGLTAVITMLPKGHEMAGESFEAYDAYDFLGRLKFAN